MVSKIAARWFEHRTMDDAITHFWEPHVIPLMRCNIWHVRGRDRDLFIDTGLGVASLKRAARAFIDRPVTAVATHAHADHVGSHHEFDDSLVHRLEAQALAEARPGYGLYLDDPVLVAELQRAGYDCEPNQCMVTAVPHAGYDIGAYSLQGSKATRVVDAGDIVDLGDRRFEIIHLPGHSPGSIGLWEADTGILFSGDCIYDGPLLDCLADSDIADYIASMKRLREIPVRVVHAGHDPSFGASRLHELIDAYLLKRDR